MTREQFTENFRALYSTSGLSVNAVAALLKTSQLTVTRWFDGTSAPHELGRASVIEAMRKAQPSPT